MLHATAPRPLFCCASDRKFAMPLRLDDSAHECDLLAEPSVQARNVRATADVAHAPKIIDSRVNRRNLRAVSREDNNMSSGSSVPGRPDQHNRTMILRRWDFRVPRKLGAI